MSSFRCVEPRVYAHKCLGVPVPASLCLGDCGMCLSMCVRLCALACMYTHLCACVCLNLCVHVCQCVCVSIAHLSVT